MSGRKNELEMREKLETSFSPLNVLRLNPTLEVMGGFAKLQINILK